MSSQARGATSARRDDSRGARPAWPPRGEPGPPAGGVGVDADQARVVMALVLLALALVCVAEAVARAGLRAPRIVPLSAGGRAEVVSVLASLIGGLG